MARFEDLSGQQFGQWTVLSRAEGNYVRTMFTCRCSCGSIRAVQACNLKQGTSTNCGCAQQIEKLCAHCSKLFKANKPAYIYCSKACARRAGLDKLKQKTKEKAEEPKICLHCGSTFYKSKSLYCSPSCSIIDRCKLDEETGCLEWQLCKNKLGYGLISHKGKSCLTHRVVYEAVYGPIPDKIFVCHFCDNPKCCNVSHLWLGTNADNMADMKRKGRAKAAKGQDHKNSKLTEEQVLDIRNSSETQTALAKKYGVSQVLISLIKLGKAWKHVERSHD